MPARMPARPHAQRRLTRLQDLTGSGRGGRPRYQKETFIISYLFHNPLGPEWVWRWTAGWVFLNQFVVLPQTGPGAYMAEARMPNYTRGAWVAYLPGADASTGLGVVDGALRRGYADAARSGHAIAEVHAR